MSPPPNSLIGQRVQVYRNLRNGLWSVRQKGLVIAHLDALYLEGVVFYVSASGQRRVRAHRQRAVHAWATGKVVQGGPACTELVRYNPYRDEGFRTASGRLVTSAKFAYFFTPPGSDEPGCFVFDPNG